MTLIYVVSAIFIIFCILMIRAQIQVMIARSQGIYPQKGQATMEDVKTLILKGNTILAMRAYREIYSVGLKKAKEEIERIKNEIKD